MMTQRVGWLFLATLTLLLALGSYALQSVSSDAATANASTPSLGSSHDGAVAAQDSPSRPRLLRRETGPTGFCDLTFDDIKFDAMQGEPFRRSLLGEKIERLDGASIRIRGYMLPSFQQAGLREFVLVRDNMECCFGPGAALCDSILVSLDAGKLAAFTVRPVAVEGIFSVTEMRGPDGNLLAIYRLQGQLAK